MGKKLLITEKPSVAMEFAKALKITTNRRNGYLESEKWIITWCVGHLVTMSYPEKYDEKLKFWRLDTLPFIPSDWKYEIIPQVENQFNIVKGLMQREDIEEIYNAGDSGREGEYIQRLVFMMAHPNPNAKMKVDFGRIVEVDRLILYLRADFPHDNWWEKCIVKFSNGEERTLSFQKTDKAQEFMIGKMQISWLEISHLLASAEPSPFPALTQIEVYGIEVREEDEKNETNS